MTDEQINQRIAEACGWKPAPRGRWKLNERVERFRPDYLNDLNAMHEAEETLMHDDPHGYGCYSCDLYEQYGNTVHLTAAQRAEAFLRTIGKWEETK